MGIKFVDLDNEKQANDYRKEKKKARFEKEIQNVVPVVKPDPVKPIMKGKVKDIDQLRVRVEPEGEILKLINRGTEFNIIADVNDIWFKIQLDDSTIGYVMKSFVLSYIEGETKDG